MKKTLGRKLNLSRETLSHLDRLDVRRAVAGAVVSQRVNCPASVGMPCITQTEYPSCRCQTTIAA